jgi:hypothetical protein
MKFGSLSWCLLLSGFLAMPPSSLLLAQTEQETPSQVKPEETKPEEKKPLGAEPETAPTATAAKDSTPNSSVDVNQQPQSDAQAASAPEPAKPPTAKQRRCRKSKTGSCAKQTASNTGTRRIVVRNGSTTEPTVKLAPTVPTNVASQQAQVTEQLLATAENNLKEAAIRQLNADQTAVVDQVRNYIQQARAATKAGDFQRGHNLAVKARLLSDDLIAQ